MRKYRDGAAFDLFYNFSDMAITGEHFGNKTNIRFIHFSGRVPPSERFVALNESKVWGIVLEKSNDERDTWRGERDLSKKTQAEATMTEEHLENECKRAVGYKGDSRCSSGGIILLWSLHHCRNMTIFGLDEDSCLPGTYGVLFSRNCSKKKEHHGWSGTHNLSMEADFFEGLVNQGNLTIHRFTL